jgi:DNA recombination protein RmuC
MLEILLLVGMFVLFIIVSLVQYFLISRRLQTSQASTQAMVTTTKEETLHSVQGLENLQRDAQTLMHEIKTQQSTAQTFFTDWHSSSQALFQGWQKDTTELRRALQTTYQQGTWGEQELRRVVELAGMVPHCDFDVQHRFPNGQKPDMVIYLHDDRSIIVDAKAHSQVYLEAVRCEDERAQAVLLKGYARRVRDSILELSGREYWKNIPSAPAMVIVFMPNEAMLRVAFDYDPTLFDLAAEKNVLLASPMILIALLKAIAHGWSQEDRARNVQRIIETSKTLQKELETWLGQWHQLKKAIQRTSDEFDRVVSGYQTRVLPLINGLGMIDSTLLVKEKAFDLQPFNESLLEARTEVSLVPEEERRDASTQTSFTEPLNKEDVTVQS